MKIAIHKDVLAQIIASAVDAFPKECFGELLGKEYNSSFKLNFAYNIYSSLRRTKTSISYNTHKVERLEKILEKFYLDKKVLGTYHSHPNTNTDLSDNDKEKILKNENLQIIISIRRTKNARDYLRCSKNKKNISGRINYYFFKIGGFYYNKNNREFQEAYFNLLPKNLIHRAGI